MGGTSASLEISVQVLVAGDQIGDLRVFYEVAADEPETVRILAVGQKKGNTLFLAGKEITL